MWQISLASEESATPGVYRSIRESIEIESVAAHDECLFVPDLEHYLTPLTILLGIQRG
jgi:hypothetical protein